MNIKKITTLDMEELKVYTQLNEPELLHLYEPDRGVFIAETPDIITRAIQRGCEPLSFLVEEKVLHSESGAIIAPYTDIPVFTAPLEVINKITGFNLTRGILSVMRRPELPTLDDIINIANHITLLDDIENPTNVGAIFRSAAALGSDGIILTGGCSDPLYRRCARVSMGTVFYIPWVKTDSDLLLDLLKENGFKIISMTLTENAVSISDPILDNLKKTVIIFGNERNGVSRDVINKSDYIVQIPMKNGVDSLNVAAASAVAFYRFFIS